ncbi:MAG: 4Fe-4S dicluster domain-containing protein [Chloroflexi bacterium]|nr:4Fe-4S dicluster domain-containing protein [Chloroflexota bacterium]
MIRYVMLIDLRLCTGCNTCSVACKQENNLPEGVWWTRVVTIGGNGDDLPAGNYPDLRLEYLPLACQHCAQGPCVDVCPSTATSRREQDGVVVQDPGLCIGCRSCMMVCPFTSVRVFADEQPRYALPFPTGDNPLVHRAHTVEKCTFCAHRLARSENPACVDVCPVQARKFGDLNDPTSEVAQLLAARLHFQLLVEKGTEPSVYYLT